MTQGTPGCSAQRERPASYLRMAELLLGSRITMALRVIVDRSIPDLLGSEAKSAAELSSQTDIAAPALERLLRALTNVGVFHEDKYGRFSNTDLSAWLRRGANPSLREISLVLNDEAPLRAWQKLDRVLQTGQPIFAEINGLTPFEYIAADPVRSGNFARLMRGVYGLEGLCIAQGFPFSRFSTLIDIGGGAGHILADILLAHPQLRGTVFDLLRTTDVARQFLSERDCADRAEVMAGDFFQAVPLGYDLRAPLIFMLLNQSVVIRRR